MSTTRLPWAAVPDLNGRVTSDPLGHFVTTDTDDVSDPQYVGKVDAAGGWVILKIGSAGTTYRYSRGDTAYPSAWTNRASLGYDRFDAIF